MHCTCIHTHIYTYVFHIYILIPNTEVCYQPYVTSKLNSIFYFQTCLTFKRIFMNICRHIYTSRYNTSLLVSKLVKLRSQHTHWCRSWIIQFHLMVFGDVKEINHVLYDTIIKTYLFALIGPIWWQYGCPLDATMKDKYCCLIVDTLTTSQLTW